MTEMAATQSVPSLFRSFTPARSTSSVLEHIPIRAIEDLLRIDIANMKYGYEDIFTAKGRVYPAIDQQSSKMLLVVTRIAPSKLLKRGILMLAFIIA
jgi:hypothetical protein